MDRLHAAAMLAFFVGAIAAVWISRNARPRGSRVRLVLHSLALATTILFIMTIGFKLTHVPALPLAQRLLVGALLVAIGAQVARPGAP